jgi:hypothetical protein
MPKIVVMRNTCFGCEQDIDVDDPSQMTFEDGTVCHERCFKEAVASFGRTPQEKALLLQIVQEIVAVSPPGARSRFQTNTQRKLHVPSLSGSLVSVS